MNFLDSYFKISERNSSLRSECLGGLTTFLAMAYIAAVNPAILMEAGIPFNAAVTATCLGAALTSAIMGLVANRPLALASGLGINAVVAYGMCGTMGLAWQVAMSVVLLEGVVFLVLLMVGMQKAIMNAIPADLRQSIGIGIGLFIAFIGLQGAGLVVADQSTLISIGNLTEPQSVVALISIAFAIIFQTTKVPGGLLLSIVIAVVSGLLLGVIQLPTTWSLGLDFSSFGAPFESIDGMPAIVHVFLQPALFLFVFSLIMTEFFGTIGTAVAVAKQADFINDNGDVEDMGKILKVDSCGTIIGGLTGASSITTFLESASGVAEGARTGLSSLIVAVMFVICAFLSPLFSMATSQATCGALVVVGFLILRNIGEIDWSHPEQALPAFLIIAGIPFTYSITNGIGLGFIAYVIIMTVRGKTLQVKPLMWVAAAAFLIMFILG